MKLDLSNEMDAVELEKLGANDLAYIRPMQIENTVQFMLVAGDGRELGTAPTFQSAYLAALDNDFELVSLH